MSDASNIAKSLRERLSENTEERLGRALSDLLENPLITGAIGRAFDARERASQAQEVAMGALNIPSAADIERLTRRLRAVSHRLEGIEDGVQRLDRALAPSALEVRLSAIEEQLGRLTHRWSAEPGAARSVTANSGARTRASGAGEPAKAKAPGASAAAKAPAKAKPKAKPAAAAKAPKAKARRKRAAAKGSAAGAGSKSAARRKTGPASS